MTVSTFLVLLTICSAITSLFTEALKTSGFIKNLPINIVVLIVAVVVGCGTTVFYYLHFSMPFNTLNIAYIIAMAIANWLCATLGYDKVLQTINQIKGETV